MKEQTERTIILVILTVLAIVLLCASGCVIVPDDVADSLRVMRTTTYVICDDYLSLVKKHYPEDEQAKKARLVEGLVEMWEEMIDLIKDK